ncbi:acetyl-CoA C-acetyltransferase [Gordonia terrae]
MTRRAAIVAPRRTPVGGFGGSLKGVPAEELATAVVKAVLRDSGVDPTRVDDVVFAQSYANSEAPCLGRWVALNAGMPVTTPGFQLDRRCGSGLQAVVTASMMVQTGAADVVLVGGVESMSRIEHYTQDARWGQRSGSVVLHDRLDRGRERSQPEWRFGRISGMVETAENLAREFGIARTEADDYSVRSHRLADEAWRLGRFDAEVVPVEVPTRRGDPLVFARDEGIRPDSTPESLARLRTVQHGGTVTAGNAAQQNDAAAACLIVAADVLDSLDLAPDAFLHSWAVAGCDPATMGIGPVPAAAKLFARNGLSLADMDLIEINEAFAVQVLAVLRSWDLSLSDVDDRLNVNGSGLSLGHPIGATGVRILTTAVHELRRRGSRYALETMCIGGGQGMAAVLEAA